MYLRRESENYKDLVPDWKLLKVKWIKKIRIWDLVKSDEQRYNPGDDPI